MIWILWTAYLLIGAFVGGLCIFTAETNREEDLFGLFPFFILLWPFLVAGYVGYRVAKNHT